MDKRRAARISARGVQGGCSYLGVPVWGASLSDLSLGGAFLECAAPLPSRLHVVVELVDAQGQRPVRLVAQVVRSVPLKEAQASGRPSGFAVAFEETSAENQRRLEALLQRGPERASAADEIVVEY